MIRIRNKGRYPAFACFIFCLIISSFITGNAYAREKKLTENKVIDFIHETTKLSSGINSGETIKSTAKYLKKHIAKRARFISTMKYSVPGQPTQESTLSLTKEDFIRSVTEGQKSVSEYESEIEIVSVEISADSKKATAITKSFEKASVPVSPDGGKTTQNIPIQGVSTCDQLITINKKGVIQMFGAKCITEIEFIDGNY